MSCEWNDDVTYYVLFIACIAVCEKVSCHSIDTMRTQGEKLACIPEAKVGICRRLVNGKGIKSAYFWYDSDFSKYKQSPFAWYHAPSTLLASNSLKRYIDANSCL